MFPGDSSPLPHPEVNETRPNEYDGRCSQVYIWVFPVSWKPWGLVSRGQSGEVGFGTSGSWAHRPPPQCFWSSTPVPGCGCPYLMSLSSNAYPLHTTICSHFSRDPEKWDRALGRGTSFSQSSFEVELHQTQYLPGALTSARSKAVELFW